MIAFEVKDMTCGHCVSTITQALKSADGQATVQIDLSRHLVRIEPGAASSAELRAAIEQAGYMPVPVPAGGPADAAAARGGCCA